MLPNRVQPVRKPAETKRHPRPLKNLEKSLSNLYKTRNPTNNHSTFPSLTIGKFTKKRERAINHTVSTEPKNLKI